MSETIYFTKDYLEEQTGKTMVNSETFQRSDDAFAAISAAESFCKARGFSVGTMQRDAPMGLKHGDFNIQKWRNLDREDRARLDGAIVGEKRHGPVTVFWCAKEDRNA